MFTSYSNTPAQNLAQNQYKSMVWTLCALGLVATAFVALIIAHTSLATMFITYDRVGHAHMSNVPQLVGMVIALLSIFAMGRSRTLPIGGQLGLAGLFYAALGLCMAPYAILSSQLNLFYPLVSAIAVFSVSALYGKNTTKDLSQMGNFMIIGLFAVIIVGLLNFLLHSSGLNFLLSILSVVIFTGLTAYDTQAMNNNAQNIDGLDKQSVFRMALGDSMNLYLDFINLFTSLVQIFNRS